ncbi:DnaB-like helicase C-terminal domain-containing protein [Streptomyces sp. MB09-01]|uniref:DnaB-like helicase C-terminal domain-containing protein n=1 Tax=Streptomyces sp. MB09-01 TaxID=3028666 RepID=UPI0029AC8A4F|nr:DnaB-like helicase C-terminal domain-containing protein [Streptomyces sp. MB09-01]MDX3536976.1 DnaB-like helicase C-terminal domain-containing protein [Streptomyces sp. MB09-01]
MQEGGHAEGFPHEQIFTNAHAERQALAGMLHSGGQAADAAAMVRVGDFTQVEHRIVFESITAIQKRDENYTLEEISQQIKAFGNWPNEEDLDDFLQELFHSLEDRRQTEAHAQTVGERSLLRRIYAAGQMISQIASTAASKESLDVNSILETIKHEIESLIPESADSPQPAEAFEQPEDGAETWSAQNISSGLRDLDALTSGFRSGCLTIIAGALSMGKTTLGADLARRCSVANGQTAVLFSLQMTRDDIATRLLAAEAQVSLSAMQSNRLSDSDWNRLAQRQAAVSEAPLYIADSPTFSIQGLRQTCKRLRRDRDLRLVIIDSIDLLTQSDELGEPRSGGGLLKLTNSLRLLARELGIPVIGLYQLGRLPEGRWSDAKPTLRDLPVEIENFADMVILLHREDAYEKESPRAGEADLIVAKNRHGRTGVAITAFQGHYARFVDMYDPFSS